MIADDNEDTDRLIRYGRHLFKVAASVGWVESEAEGPMEWIMRKCREQALLDALDGHPHLNWVREQRDKGEL